MSDQPLRIGTRRGGFSRRSIGALIVLGFIVAIGLILLGLIGDFLVDWLWFRETGYFSVFWTVILAKGAVFSVVLVASAIILLLNGLIALRLASVPTGPPPPSFGNATVPEVAEFLAHWRHFPRVVAIAALVLALFIAWHESDAWALLLRFVYQMPAGASDPLFNHDIGFYLFSLPAYVAIKNWLMLVLFISAALAALIYFVRGDIVHAAPRRTIAQHAIAHLSVLLAGFLLVKAGSYLLDRYLLLYGDNGVVVGAAYTDVHVQLPVLWLLAGLALVAALLSLANVRARALRLPIAAVVLVFATSIIVGGIAPALIQRIYVKPNELRLERPYLESNIRLTQLAYNLGAVTVAAFPATQDLTAPALAANEATIGNIRLWDWQPLMDTYSQLQEIRTYYKFHEVDIDRYWLGNAYQAVMLAARELKPSLLPANAQTWVNRHLLFTHGNGVVMSPVTRKTSEGLPFFYLRDI
ncbi:MAG TPA: UPF0182 family protein, partial [Xanthobacteraceae bacterium]|nr:UPF0182 family protein [Xanthobacteraceae bacterium]